MRELMGAHVKTLMESPPVRGGTSFDMSNVVEQALGKGRQ